MDFAALYDDDIEGWAEAQVAALRRLATTPGPWSNVIDFENVIEEIEELSPDRRAARRLLRNAFAHSLKVVADPEALSVRRWSLDALDFLEQAQQHLSGAVRNRLDIDAIWADARLAATNALRDYDRTLPASVPTACPFTFDQVVAMNPDADIDETLLRWRRAG